MGIPHIYGTTDADAFYGAGYMMARDRLFQMELLRRRALGRLAEVMGTSSRGDDELMRRFNFRDLGRQDFERLRDESPEGFELILAWSAGINRFIEEVGAGEAPLPYGFGPGELDFAPEPWHPSDLIVLSRMAFFSASSTLEPEMLSSVMREFFPDAFDAIELVRPCHDVWIVPPEDRPAGMEPRPSPRRPLGRRPARSLPADFTEAMTRFDRLMAPYRRIGSNNFAIDGRFTENGRPLIANDPHLGLEVPGIFYALHINSSDGEGSMNVAGFTLAGSFGVSTGRNDRLAWTVTSAFGDVMDLWDVRQTEEGVMIGEVDLPLVHRREAIIVRGEGMPAGEGERVLITADDVPGHGMILPSSLIGIPLASPGRQLVLNYTGFGPMSGIDALLDLQRAESLDEFEAAIDGVTWLGFNFVGANASGISYRVGLGVPDRGDPASIQPPYLVMDGDDGSSFWTDDILPPDHLPRARAATRGFLVTANNDPFGFTGDGDVLNDPWYYGGIFAAGFRAKRLDDELTRLTARGEVTVEEAIALQLDVHSPLADSLLPALASAWTHVGEDPDLDAFDDPDLGTLVAVLTDGWDREMRRDSPAALVFRSFVFNLTSTVLQDDLSTIYGMISSIPAGMLFMIRAAGMVVTGGYPEGDSLLQQGVDVALLAALARTRDWLVGRFGGVDPSLYTFGDASGIRLIHELGGQLDVGFFPISGSDYTVANFPGALVGEPGARRFESRFGPVMRIVSSFAEDGTPESLVSIPLGNHGDPSSPHFDDLLEDYIEGRHRPLPFRRAEVEAAMEERIILPSEGSARP
jgi:penicillin amidase